MSMPKGLNVSGGANRFRFQLIRDRVATVDVNIARKIRGVLAEDLVPEAGDTGCFFKEQLDMCKQMDMSRQFRSFYNAVYFKVQNMALLLHNLPFVANTLATHLKVSCMHFQL